MPETSELSNSKENCFFDVLSYLDRLSQQNGNFPAFHSPISTYCGQAGQRKMTHPPRPLENDYCIRLIYPLMSFVAGTRNGGLSILLHLCKSFNPSIPLYYNRMTTWDQSNLILFDYISGLMGIFTGQTLQF